MPIADADPRVSFAAERTLGLVLALGAVVAPGARAQSANCEAFKARIAASIEAKGISGYALDFVPRRTAVPPGARSVGTCDGGAYTLLYRRWAGAGTPAAASAADAEPAAQPASAAEAKAESKAASRAAKAKTAPSPRPAAEPAPTAALPPPPPVSQAPSPAQPASAAPHAAVSQTPMAPAAVTRSPGIAVAAAAPPAVTGSTTTFDDIARPVVWGVVGVLAAYAGLRAWRRWRYRRYYDEAGLPRGPRITL